MEYHHAALYIHYGTAEYKWKVRYTIYIYYSVSQVGVSRRSYFSGRKKEEEKIVSCDTTGIDIVTMILFFYPDRSSAFAFRTDPGLNEGMRGTARIPPLSLNQTQAYAKKVVPVQCRNE